MHFSKLSCTALLGFFGAAMALPSSSSSSSVDTGTVAAPGTEIIYLDNGNTTVPVVVDTVSVDTAATGTLARRSDPVDCKGSSRCSNGQEFKDLCRQARDKIEDTQYTPGGSKSGVCASNIYGGCGIFVRGGSNCGAAGWQLREAYDVIRAGGCQACGSAHRSFGGCLFTINFVTGCGR